MYTVRHLFSKLCDPAHLEAAAAKTVHGKRRRCDVALFLLRLDEEIETLRAALEAGTYQPHSFELVTIRDPKPRLIARVPIADRVLHTALVELIEPVFLRGLRPEAYACRQGLGTHRAVLRLLELMRRHHYALHLDVRSYFPSIDLEILRGLLARRIRDAKFLGVVDRVLESGRRIYTWSGVRERAGLAPDWPPPGWGLPIGAYTSQLFAAHVYLAELDHFVKRQLKIPGFVRYVDDLVLLAKHRAPLKQARNKIARWLATERGLKLKHPRARILSCRGHLDVLGYRITRDGVEPRPRTLRRLRRRVATSVLGRPRPGFDLERSIASSAGSALF